MPYTSGIGFRSWHADHPSFKRLGAGTPSRFALVFTSAIERVPKQNRPILSRACPRVSERILAKKRVSEFPNTSGVFTSFDMEEFEEPTEAFRADWSVNVRLQRNDESGSLFRESGLVFNASNGNALFGASETVQPASMRTLALIRAF